MFEDICSCSCGAIHIWINDVMYSMSHDTFIEKYGQGHDIERKFGNCNHCVNHWGIDLCACGSGEPVAECDGGCDVCGQPSQIIEEGQTHVCAKGGWGC